MTISTFQNSSHPKWRVTKSINKKMEQYYFPMTQKGHRAAVKKEKELEAIRLENCLFGKSKKACFEGKNKGFKTGVVGISIVITRGVYPAFRLTYMPNKYTKPLHFNRSILKHGFDKAWSLMCNKLKKLDNLRDDIPLPPCKKKAKKYLRSIGVPKEYLRF